MTKLTKKDICEAARQAKKFALPETIKNGKIELKLTEYIFDQATGKLLGGTYLLSENQHDNH